MNVSFSPISDINNFLIFGHVSKLCGSSCYAQTLVPITTEYQHDIYENKIFSDLICDTITM